MIIHTAIYYQWLVDSRVERLFNSVVVIGYLTIYGDVRTEQH